MLYEGRALLVARKEDEGKAGKIMVAGENGMKGELVI